jgi:hypothetical protein
MSRVIIGMDPHKRSATIEVMAGNETVLGGGRFGTDVAGYRSMLAEPPRLPARTRVLATGQGRKTDAADAHPGGAGRHPDDRPAPGGR